MSRTIICGNKEYTVDEYIRREICANKGTQNNVMKKELIKLCETQGISLDGKETKDVLYDKLISGGVSPKDLAVRYGVGVSSQVYQHIFGIDHKRVKQLEKQGTITVVGRYRFRAFGKTLYAPLYDVYEYCNIGSSVVTGEEIVDEE